MYQSHNLFSFEIYQKMFPPTQIIFTAGFGIKNICFQLFLRVEQKRFVLRKGYPNQVRMFVVAYIVQK